MPKVSKSRISYVGPLTECASGRA